MARRFHKGSFDTLSKKMNAMACEDHRTISLIPHASKIMLRILTKDWKEKLEILSVRHSLDSRKDVEPEKQFGLCECYV